MRKVSFIFFLIRIIFQNVKKIKIHIQSEKPTNPFYRKRKNKHT